MLASTHSNMGSVTVWNSQFHRRKEESQTYIIFRAKQAKMWKNKADDGPSRAL